MERVSKPQLGQALRYLRRAQKLTQLSVSARARKLLGSRLGAEQISKWENGHDWPTLQSLVDFLIAVDRDLCDLQRALSGIQGAESEETRLEYSPELRSLVAELIGESDEMAQLRSRVDDLETRLGVGAG